MGHPSSEAVRLSACHRGPCTRGGQSWPPTPSWPWYHFSPVPAQLSDLVPLATVAATTDSLVPSSINTGFCGPEGTAQQVHCLTCESKGLSASACHGKLKPQSCEGSQTRDGAQASIQPTLVLGKTPPSASVKENPSMGQGRARAACQVRSFLQAVTSGKWGPPGGAADPKGEQECSRGQAHCFSDGHVQDCKPLQGDVCHSPLGPTSRGRSPKVPVPVRAPRCLDGEGGGGPGIGNSHEPGSICFFRNLGKSGLRVSCLGLGEWGVPWVSCRSRSCPPQEPRVQGPGCMSGAERSARPVAHTASPTAHPAKPWGCWPQGAGKMAAMAGLGPSEPSPKTTGLRAGAGCGQTWCSAPPWMHNPATPAAPPPNPPCKTMQPVSGQGPLFHCQGQQQPQLQRACQGDKSADVRSPTSGRSPTVGQGEESSRFSNLSGPLCLLPGTWVTFGGQVTDEVRQSPSTWPLASACGEVPCVNHAPGTSPFTRRIQGAQSCRG